MRTTTDPTAAIPAPELPLRVELLATVRIGEGKPSLLGPYAARTLTPAREILETPGRSFEAMEDAARLAAEALCSDLRSAANRARTGSAPLATTAVPAVSPAPAAGELEAEARQALSLILDTPALFVVSADLEEHRRQLIAALEESLQLLDPLRLDVGAANVEHEATITAGRLGDVMLRADLTDDDHLTGLRELLKRLRAFDPVEDFRGYGEQLVSGSAEGERGQRLLIDLAAKVHAGELPAPRTAGR